MEKNTTEKNELLPNIILESIKFDNVPFALFHGEIHLFGHGQWSLVVRKAAAKKVREHLCECSKWHCTLYSPAWLSWTVFFLSRLMDVAFDGRWTMTDDQSYLKMMMVLLPGSAAIGARLPGS